MKLVVRDATKEEIDEYIKKTFGKCCGCNCSEKPNGSEGVKIPVISMEDVPKIAKEMEK